VSVDIDVHHCPFSKSASLPLTLRGHLKLTKRAVHPATAGVIVFILGTMGLEQPLRRYTLDFHFRDLENDPFKVIYGQRG